jgi:hypothetical protein
MTTALPVTLRNTLARLLVEALDAPAAPGRTATPAAAIALLIAYGRLARRRGNTIRLADLVGETEALTDEDARRAVDSLCDGILARGPRSNGGETVELPPDFVPHAAAIQERAAAYRRVLDARQALPRLPAAHDARALVDAAFLFDAALFFEVHEVLEIAWRRSAGDTKTLLQGLLQSAVAFHHYIHGKPASARTLLAKGEQRIRAACGPRDRFPVGDRTLPEVLVETGAFLAELGAWRRALTGIAATAPVTDPPPLPRLRVTPCGEQR